MVLYMLFIISTVSIQGKVKEGNLNTPRLYVLPQYRFTDYNKLVKILYQAIHSLMNIVRKLTIFSYFADNLVLNHNYADSNA